MFVFILSIFYSIYCSFITLDTAKHLDGKHTVFGKLVGGMDTLNAIEEVGAEPTSDEPREPVWFMAAKVFFDPFEVAEAEVQKERESLSKSDKNEIDETEESKVKLKTFKSGVGKYIAPSGLTQKRPVDKSLLDPGPSIKKKIIPRSQLSDFSSW